MLFISFLKNTLLEVEFLILILLPALNYGPGQYSALG